MSQTFAPILLLFLTWQTVVIAVVIANVVWAVFIRYRHVSIQLAAVGAVLTRLKWIICLSSGVYLWVAGNIPNSLFALFWPLLIFIIGALPTVHVGRIQKIFIDELLSGSYSHDLESSAASPLFESPSRPGSANCSEPRVSDPFDLFREIFGRAKWWHAKESRARDPEIVGVKADEASVEK